MGGGDSARDGRPAREWWRASQRVRTLSRHMQAWRYTVTRLLRHTVARRGTPLHAVARRYTPLRTLLRERFDDGKPAE